MSKNEAGSRIIKDLRNLTNGKKGLWINNLTLKESMDVGDKAIKDYNFESKTITITKVEDGENSDTTISYRKSSPGTPILDLKNNTFHEMYKDVEKVEIKFLKGKIIITIAEIEKNEIKRREKTSMKTFELFCGGGTLSHHFKLAGFNPSGGVEFNENCLNYYINNHGHEGTILSDIKDVTASMYPKDIEVVLVGIPCQTFTKANKQMVDAKARDAKGIASEEDQLIIDTQNQAEYLTFYVLEALRAMNPKTIVVEEVVEYTSTQAYAMLKYILKVMNYNITETISEGSHTKRKRWCLVANTGPEIPLDDIIPYTEKVLAEVIGLDVESADWKKSTEIKRLDTASKKNTIGIRYASADSVKCNTFTCHATRHTEPCLKHPDEDLYLEFTNQNIADIHGLRGYKLDTEDLGNKTTSRYVLGNGVTDMFYHIANRILIGKAYEDGRLF